MSQFLARMLAHQPSRVPLAADALVRENTAPVALSGSIWDQVGRILSRQDYIDAATGNIGSWLSVKLGDGRVLPLSARIRVRERTILEIETVVGSVQDASAIPAAARPATLSPEHRSSRQDLIELANGYFEALGMLDPGAAKLSASCIRHDRGGAEPCADGLLGRSGQQVIERRFPLAIPELGVVIAYGIVMHHERSPPEDEFVNAWLRIEDGRIVAIRPLTVTVVAPGRSGFAADLPPPGIIRGAPAKLLPVVAAEKPAAHFPGYWRLRSLLERWRPSPPAATLPAPPYAGITAARDLRYGADPAQRLDVLAPAEAAARPRTVLVFVHGGDWTGGDKHFANDILYENVVYWAARQGMVGVNVDYRLADYQAARNLYPTQEQDVAAAVDWIGAHIANYGGDPGRIFLWGHSSGGSTIAGYASNPGLYGRTPGVTGLFLLSAPLDPVAEEQRGEPIYYFGRTAQQLVERAPLRGLLTSNVPVLMGYSPQESDLAPELERARRALCGAGRCPVMVATQGSHDGEMRAVGSADRSATDALLAFMAKIP